MGTAFSMVAHLCKAGMPFQNNTGRGFEQRCAQQPTACRIQLGAFLERLHTQDQHPITLRRGEEGRRLPECLEASIRTAQERQIRPRDAELDSDFCWDSTWGSVGKMQG